MNILKRMFAVITVMFSSPILADDLSKQGALAVDSFMEGNIQSLWDNMTPEMHEALGSKANFATFRNNFINDFGEELQVQREHFSKQGVYSVYERISVLSLSDQEIQYSVSFDNRSMIAGFYIRPLPSVAESAYLDYKTNAELRLPVRGEWFVFWGGRTIDENYHAIDAGQRFAIDLLIYSEDKSYADDPNILEKYYCWGQPIYSPSEGLVVVAVDGLPDQKISKSDVNNPAGNHVVIDFGNSEFGFLAHLKNGSVQVKVGDKVNSSTQIGNCGNSGNSSEPHLHFHLQNSQKFGEGEGLPAQFSNYLLDGQVINLGEPRRGQTISYVLK